MRIALTFLAAVVMGVAGFYGAIVLASESGEVVTLTTFAADGTPHATRLWVVDHDGLPWVRTGHPGKGWFVRTRANARVELERAGEASARKAVAVSDAGVAAAVNEKFATQYGAADWIVALSGDAADRVVVRLDPEQP